MTRRDHDSFAMLTDLANTNVGDRYDNRRDHDLLAMLTDLANTNVGDRDDYNRPNARTCGRSHFY